MSYQTGTASSPTDLLQTLVTWLVSIGWTQDMSQADGSGWRAHLHKSGNYANFRASMNESPWANNSNVGYSLNLYLGTGYNGGANWRSQAGAPLGTGTSNAVGVAMPLNSGPFSNYYFFADSAGDNVVVVLEKTPGLYDHLGWGSSLEKAGAWTGGPYFFGTVGGYYANFAAASAPGFNSTSDCPGVTVDTGGGVNPVPASAAFVRADVDSFTGNWIDIAGEALTAAKGQTGKEGRSSVRGTAGRFSSDPMFPTYATGSAATQFQNLQTSAQDGRANLLPLLLWVLRDGTTTGYSLLGSIPNVFCTNGVGNGFSNATEYAIGAVTYKMFPKFCVVKQ